MGIWIRERRKGIERIKKKPSIANTPFSIYRRKIMLNLFIWQQDAHEVYLYSHILN